MKFIKGALAFAAVILVAIGIMLFTQMDALIKAAIEAVGPRITQTTLKVASVHVSPFSGSGRIHNLEIGNPKGFQSDSAFKLKNIRVSLVPKSLTSEKIIIRQLLVEGPEITFEITRSGNNLQAIQKNVESFTPATKTDRRAARGGEQRLELDLFVLREAKVHVRSHVIGNQEIDISLPEITLKDIGSGPQGATVKEVVATVLHSITTGVTKAVTSSGALKNLNQTLKSAQGSLKKSLQGILGH